MIFSPNKTNCAGALIILSILFGIGSIASSIDDINFMQIAADDYLSILIAAGFQTAMALTYVGVGVLLYPTLSAYSSISAISFISFRIMAAIMVLLGTIVMIMILLLSQAYFQLENDEGLVLLTIGNVLKYTRDYVNHVFMIFILGIANIIMFAALLKLNSLSKWFTVVGIVGAILAILASLLVMFQVLNVISFYYIALNLPAAMVEIALGFRLAFKPLLPLSPKTTSERKL